MLISYTFQQFFFLKYVDAAIAFFFVVKIMIDLQKKKIILLWIKPILLFLKSWWTIKSIKVFQKNSGVQFFKL
jgi:hypothetical protein